MKSILYIIILSVIAPLFIACSEDLNLCAQQNTVVETDYSCDDVILQERNPSLPDVITGQPSFDEVFIIPYQEPLNLTSLSLASFPLR
jgi:hypothetical protein